MPSRAEQIADAVRIRLTAPAMTSVPAASVYRELRGALQAERLPAIAIEPGNEPEPQRIAYGVLHRRVEIVVTVLAAGNTGYSAADPGHAEVFSRLLADPTLGGLALDVEFGAIRRERDDGERPRAAITTTYRYVYRTTEGSIA